MSEDNQRFCGGNETIPPQILDQVPNVTIHGPPAVAFYNGKIYLAYAPEGDQFLGQIWTTNFDGTNWSQPFQLLFPSNTFNPALGVYQGVLYCAADNGDQAWHMTFDGAIWAPAKAIPNSPQISTNPSLAANSETLYVAYQKDQSNDVWYQTFDGINWSQPAPTPAEAAVQGASGAVGLAADPDGNVYLAYQSVDSNSIPTGQLWYTTLNGKNWSPPAQVPSVSIFAEPALTFYNGTLYCLHLRSSVNNAQNLSYLTFDGESWSGDTPLTESPMSLQSPAIAPVLANFANRGPGLYFFVTTTVFNVFYFYRAPS
ncbi:sialidase family protein [Pandoraea pulmonicola]|uniref:Predicted neuraminidase (Sialidase) n=1 Tax=Pandoraea pulmonicola TaxID=93221 RepID=A0AAJ5D2V0_PANPU|nr:sialidase family protein [Pandoraea pulmonicola]AJC22565.1 hypothetical protein RO07_22610 [Pandoraea pulmonicola]SUA93246.1 Predicted neuraminidase (sialidase) [Pandoraea pulmonicola]